jgi:mono/diheme cytochrome c family protein
MRLTIAAVALGLLVLAPKASSAQDAAKGEGVYAANKCTMCHSIAGKGGKASALDGVGKKLSAADIKMWIVDTAAAEAKFKSTKKPAMPKTYAKLPAAEVDALVAYLSSLK